MKLDHNRNNDECNRGWLKLIDSAISAGAKSKTAVCKALRADGQRMDADTVKLIASRF